MKTSPQKRKFVGPIKLYRKACFQQIGGLKKAMGWDTVDELLATYHGWKIITNEDLHVIHLKPTGSSYSSIDAKKQGAAFKNMRYGFLISFIAAMKLAFKKKSLVYFFRCLQGFLVTKPNYIVTKQEGVFIRKLRCKNMKKKLF